MVMYHPKIWWFDAPHKQDRNNMQLVKALLSPLFTALSLSTKDTTPTPTDSSTSCINAFNNMTKIAVLGGGSVGSTLAKALSDSQQQVVIAARNPTKTKAKLLEAKLDELIVEASADALKTADVVILATPGAAQDADIQALAKSLGDTTNKIIIDATNPLGPFPEGLNVRWDKTTSGGEVLAAALPTAKVYKAFNTVGVEHMKSALGKDMMFAGDADEASLQIVEDIIKGVGFKPFYVGPIPYARNLEAIAELWIHMAIPPLGARTTTRNFWFAIAGDP
jgi:predicted dinucleotide-binding enzyme